MMPYTIGTGIIQALMAVLVMTILITVVTMQRSMAAMAMTESKMTMVNFGMETSRV